MFTNLIQLLLNRRGPPEDYELAFVREVTVKTTEPRSRRVERVIIISWILIALKCALVWWAFGKYHVPFNAWWINAPTIAMGAVCTALYIWRR